MLGEGEGSPRHREGGGGDWLYIENPRTGGSPRGARGREGVCGELGNLGRGGAKYVFFSGPKCPPRKRLSGSYFRNNLVSEGKFLKSTLTFTFGSPWPNSLSRVVVVPAENPLTTTMRPK